jgi:hypothetical protein
MNAMPLGLRPAPDDADAVDVVDVSSPELRTWRGRAASDGAFLALHLEPGAGPLSVGTPVVLDWPATQRPRVVATVILAAHPRYQLRLRRQVARDRRVFPRLAGQISLRYLALARRPELDLEVTGGRWLSLGLVPAGSTDFERPDPNMNFSVNGLRFADGGGLVPGDHVLCEVGVLGDTERWRVVASVARRTEPEEDDHNTPRLGAETLVALRFCDPPEGLIEALAAYTLALQREDPQSG